MIQHGYSAELDLLKGDMSDGRGIVAQIEAREREKTGIPKLKVGYNRVFGYYIEVTNSYKEMVPQDYIRKQTLTNCERFITQELKELEGRILGAHDKSVQLEYTLFDEVRKTVAAQLARVQKTAAAVAQLDVLNAFAQVSVNQNYTRPIVNLEGKILIKDGIRWWKSCWSLRSCPTTSRWTGAKIGWRLLPGRIWQVSPPICVRRR